MTETTPPQRRLSTVVCFAVALVLTSCSPNGTTSSLPASSPTPVRASTPASSSSAPSATAIPPASMRIDITVTGKNVTPPPAMVNIAVGESLTVTITSDHDNMLHAHGFDIEQAVKAGQRLDVTVKGARPGVYDVELHEPELRLLQVAVR